MSHRDDGAMVWGENTGLGPCKEAIMELPEVLQSGACRVSEMLAKMAKSVMPSFIQIGMVIKEELLKIKEGEAHGESNYGDHAVEQWAKAINIPSRTLYTCLRLSQLYTQEKYMKLVECGLTWTHFVYLVSIEDDEERQKLEEQVISEKLSVTALSEEIRQAYGNRRKGSGRSPALPRNLPQALLRLEKASNTYGNVLGMLTDEYDFYRAFADTCPAEWSEEMYTQIADEISTLDQIAATSRELSDRLRQENDRGLRILEKRREKTIEATFEEVVEVEPKVAESPAINQQKLTPMTAKPVKKRSAIVSEKPRDTPKAAAQEDNVPLGKQKPAKSDSNGANPELAKQAVVSEGRPRAARSPLIKN